MFFVTDYPEQGRESRVQLTRQYNCGIITFVFRIVHKFPKGTIIMSNNEKNWGYEAVFYQIYPLGMCGAPFENDGVPEHRILKVIDWAEHIEKLGCNAVYFSPVFESDTHGYNTRDYKRIDTRLGTNEDFKKVVAY